MDHPKSAINKEISRLEKLGLSPVSISNPIRLERARFLVRIYDSRKVEIGSVVVEGTPEEAADSCGEIQNEMLKRS